jgi:hypothetical protein
MKFLIFMISVLTVSLYAQSDKVSWWEFSSGFGISKNAGSAVMSGAGQDFTGVSRNGNTEITSNFFTSYSAISTGVDNTAESVPLKYQLYQNYPNPFNPSTVISWQLPEKSHVLLKVYNILGKEVSTLVNEEKPGGKYKITFDAGNLASGVYFYRLITDSFIQTKKMMLIR